jgi:hypothetical protein
MEEFEQVIALRYRRFIYPFLIPEAERMCCHCKIVFVVVWGWSSSMWPLYER